MVLWSLDILIGMSHIYGKIIHVSYLEGPYESSQCKWISASWVQGVLAVVPASQNFYLHIITHGHFDTPVLSVFHYLLSSSSLPPSVKTIQGA